MIRRIVASQFCLGAVLLSGSVGAQDNAQVLLDYVAPSECPPAAAFQQAVTSRLPEDRRVNLGVPPTPINDDLGLQVRVVKTAGGYRAELTTITKEGRSSPRNLEGPVCAELMDAMAFTAALTVDPNAASTPAEPPRGAPPPATAASAPHETRLSPNGQSPPSETRRSAAVTPDSIEASPDAPPEHATPVHVPQWETSIAAGIVLTAPVSPGVSPGLLAGLRHSDEAPGPWSPAVTLAVFGSRLVSSYSSRASFSSVGAHLEFCPSSVHDRSITIRPCLAGQLTLVSAAGQNLTHAAEVTVAIPSLGGHVELRHALSERWFLAGIVGAQVTLQKHRFDAGRPAEELAVTRPVAPLVSLQFGALL